MCSFHSKKIKVSEKPFFGNRLMLFDLSIYGHHPGYIQYLLQYWHHHQLSGEIIILVSPRFLIEHYDVVKFTKRLNPNYIQFISISNEEEKALKSRKNKFNRKLRNFQEWFLFCSYAKKLKIDHALLMYYDIYQYPLLLRLNPPCSVSGIYFRPTFHYKYLSNLSVYSSYLKTKWETIILNLVLSNPKLNYLFTIDPFVVKYFKENSNHFKLIHLPDPVQVREYSQIKLIQVKASLNVENGRKLFLLFGALTERKGIYELLNAIQFLPQSTCRKIAIALIGEAAQEHQDRIESQVAELYRYYPIQIYRKYEFLPEEDVQAYFEVADFILAPYQRHVGMSGILNLAAAKQKPVLSSDYGLMGEIVNRYGLGITVNSTSSPAIAEGIQILLKDETNKWDSLKMREFAMQNSAENFAKSIFNYL